MEDGLFNFLFVVFDVEGNGLLVFAQNKIVPTYIEGITVNTATKCDPVFGLHNFQGGGSIGIPIHQHFFLLYWD